jgi:hypothetical protein
MSSKDKKLLVVVIICLVAAGLLFAWNLGWFEGSPKPSSTPPVPTENEQPKGGPHQAPPVG